VAIGWYLVVSAMIFCIGANLALVAFARMWGSEDGQILALIVMVVAACEVTVGLGLIVAIYRRHLPVDVDELGELQG
jgi:NADH:ubiquinone oxidoreductase subunit K